MKMSKIVFVSILGVLFFMIMTLVILEKTIFIDDYFYELVRSLESDFFDNYFIYVTKFGNRLFVVLLVVVLALVFRNKNSVNAIIELVKNCNK